MSTDIHILLSILGTQGEVFDFLKASWADVQGVFFSENFQLNSRPEVAAAVEASDMSVEGLRAFSILKLDEKMQEHYRFGYGEFGVDANYRVSALLNKAEPYFDHARFFICMNRLIRNNKNFAVIYSGMTFMHFEKSVLRVDPEWASMVSNATEIFDIEFVVCKMR